MLLHFGHSGVYSGFSPVVLFQEFGITSYASGASLQPMDKINQLLDEAVKYQKPKIVFLDVDCLYILQKNDNRLSDIFSAFYLSLSMEYIENKRFLSAAQNEK